MMTQKEMMKQVRAAGCTVKVEDGEICVGYKGSTYFTNDRDDAIGTANNMAHHQARQDALAKVERDVALTGVVARKFSHLGF